MLTRRGASRARLWTMLALLVLGGIEAAGRYYPSLMPVQWQIYSFAIDYPFRVLPDAELGFTMPPNQREVIRTRDYTFLSETDAKGYPNRDPWPENPSLVFLGDSLILGTGVGLDHSFTGLLKAMLPDRPLVNLGLAGAGPERQARVYRRFGRSWHPDLVVSCLFLASDFDNDVQFLSWLRDGRGADYVEYRLRVARAAHRRPLWGRILDQSVILDHTIRPVLQWSRRAEFPEQRFRAPDGSEILFDRNALTFAMSPAAPDDPRLDTFARSIEQLRELVEKSGARLLVMLIPSKEELFGASASRLNLTSRFKGRLGTMSVPVLDLYPAFQQRAAAEVPFYPRDLHLNVYGNRIVAEEFAAWYDRQRRAPE